MSELPLEQVKAVYRAAIDPDVKNTEGASWWQAVAAEVRAVISAPTAKAAGEIITWWHREWSAVGDHPTRAAQRLRSAARRFTA
ncbi:MULTISPECIES: hypothetical protein [Pseudomonas]|uniref:Uncharacterized protein n=1 Tax=Pseudomonas nitroreducens TaxID=46680 RepID=A0A6G6J8A3_PSENT|nr:MULTISPECIES: hypothetical protein [Pseudomonas]MDU4254065.1 hypothetical protein [Pseudomonas sp.]QIE91578.1 hypothetical protein G5B91_35185 [Pseudomonas nitroreducens]